MENLCLWNVPQNVLEANCNLAQETPCQDYLVFAQSLCYVTTNSFPLEQNGDHVTEEKF